MIRILPPEETRKIAAGEVIDRPASLVREFMDNSIDAGAGLIEVSIEEGGISRIEVADDGCGMGRNDLEICILPHATSKIRSLKDLGTAETLGFRGEALAAAEAVSRLEVLSSQDGREAWKLSSGPSGKVSFLEQSARARGTSVRSLGLYDTIPARKRFLKRPGAEAGACRQIFNEKALAFPMRSFRFSQDGVLKSFLPPVTSLRERFLQVFLEDKEANFLHEISAMGDGFSVSIVAGGPELSRGDRRLQYIFANNRRIQDYSLLQAMEYGLQGWFPNGSHPIGAVFVSIDPALADFNIHPAKKEARFADPNAIHQRVSAALRDFCRRAYSVSSYGDDIYPRETRERKQEEFSFERKPSSFGNPGDGGTSLSLAMGELLAGKVDFAPLPGRGSLAAEQTSPYTVDGKIHFLGRLFGLFILVQRGDGLYIIDQHAAHERILYDELITGPVAAPELLVPIPFCTESPEEDEFLLKKQEELRKLGIVINRGEGNQWHIEALPSMWKLGDPETVEEILSLKAAGENIAERWLATLSCHKAVKEGDYLDEGAALALAEKAFTLPVRRCPHGRPIWLEITREELFRAVKRA